MPDFIGRFTGGNPATSDRTPDGSNAVKEFLKVIFAKSAISNGTIIITNDEGQKALTGKGAEETIAMINRDTGHANQPVDKIDVNEVEKKAEFKQQFKQDLLNEAFKHGDAAYKAMFLEKAPVSVIETDKNGKPIFDEVNGVRQYRYRWLTDEEKKQMEKDAAEGKVQVFTNGIFNKEQAAANNAVQYVGENRGPIYFVHSQQADTGIGELLTAAYEKVLDNRLIGLTNASAQIEELALLYGRNGLHLYGHSRGSMIINNAMGALHDDGAADDVLAKTGVNFFEPAANAQQTAQRLNELSGGKQDTVILENHEYDFVGRLIGGNPATTHKIPDGSSALNEIIKMLLGKNSSVHGCSGPVVSAKCDKDYGNYNPVLVGPNGVK